MENKNNPNDYWLDWKFDKEIVRKKDSKFVDKLNRYEDKNEK